MYNWYIEHIDSIFLSLTVLIGFIPLFTEVKREEKIYAVPAKNILEREWRKLPRPTLAGWFLVGCIVAIFFVSGKKDEADKADKIKFQTDLLNADRDAKEASTNYAIKIEDFNKNLVRSDTLHSKMMSNFIVQLNKWGLTIRDSFIVKKNTPFITSPVSPNVGTYYQSKDTFGFSCTIANTGGEGGVVDAKVNILIIRNDKYYAFKDFASLYISLPANTNEETDTGYIVPYIYRSETDIVYMIIEGSYYNSMKQGTDFSIVYVLSKRRNKWTLATNPRYAREKLRTAQHAAPPTN